MLAGSFYVNNFITVLNLYNFVVEVVWFIVFLLLLCRSLFTCVVSAGYVYIRTFTFVLFGDQNCYLL